MSNPAVLSLASLEAVGDVGYRFEIEDNIGEAVHIHYKEIRLDLTVQEFYEISVGILIQCIWLECRGYLQIWKKLRMTRSFWKICW